MGLFGFSLHSPLCVDLCLSHILTLLAWSLLHFRLLCMYISPLRHICINTSFSLFTRMTSSASSCGRRGATQRPTGQGEVKVEPCSTCLAAPFPTTTARRPPPRLGHAIPGVQVHPLLDDI